MGTGARESTEMTDGTAKGQQESLEREQMTVLRKTREMIGRKKESNFIVNEIKTVLIINTSHHILRWTEPKGETFRKKRFTLFFKLCVCLCGIMCT